MAWRRSQTGVFRRLLLWILLMSAGAVVIFNMVFVLQTASELALLPHNFQNEKSITHSPVLNDKNTRVEASHSEGKQGGVQFT